MTQLQPIYDRPPEGLARGRWDAPPWAITAVAAFVVFGTLAYLVRRTRVGRPGRRTAAKDGR